MAGGRVLFGQAPQRGKQGVAEDGADDDAFELAVQAASTSGSGSASPPCLRTSRAQSQPKGATHEHPARYPRRPAAGRVPREVPAAMAMAGATAIELAARLRRRDTAVTRAGTRVLLEGSRQRLTSQRAERELGVTFRPLHQTIGDEAAWYRGHGMLPAGPERPKAGAVIRLRPPAHSGDNGGSSRRQVLRQPGERRGIAGSLGGPRRIQAWRDHRRGGKNPARSE